MNLIELLKEDIELSIFKYILKPIFVNKLTKAICKKATDFLSVLLSILSIIVVLFFVSRTKLANNFKLGLAMVLMLGLSILIYQTTKKEVVGQNL
ncbi:MAG: hypothetical protein ACK5QC_12760 [Bacteroidota bacterium]